MHDPYPLSPSPQDIESKNINVVKRLFKIQNINASTIRTVMVAHCRLHDNPDLLQDYEAQSKARALAQSQPQRHQPLLFDLGSTDSEEEDEDEERRKEMRLQGLLTAHLPQLNATGLEHVIQVSTQVVCYGGVGQHENNMLCCVINGKCTK